MEYVFFAVCMLVALALLAVPTSARMPEEGIRAWLRSAFRSARDPIGSIGEAKDVDIEDLLADDPSVPGYVTPDQLRGRVDGLKETLSR